MKKINFVTSLGLVLAIGSSITGCGGSGTSTESTTSFPSNAVIAEPTLENGQKVEEAVANNPSYIGLNSVQDSSGGFNIGLIGTKLINKIKLDNYSLNETINETESCLYGGSINFSGSGSEQSGATLTVTYDNCNDDETGSVSGKVYYTLSDYDFNGDMFKNQQIKYLTDVTITLSSNDNKIIKILKGATANYQIKKFDEYGNLKEYDEDISAIITDGTKTYGNKNCKYTYNVLSWYQTSWYQTSGDIYIDNLSSYVTYDTSYDMSQTPFVLDAFQGLISGEARFKMSGDGKVKIVIESNEPKTYVDANGDGIYELSE